METETLYVLDFADCTVGIYRIEADQQIEDVEDFIEQQGYRVKDCQFMYGDITVNDHRPTV